MGAADRWLQVVASIRADGGPRRSAHVRDLYELAVKDGQAILASFLNDLGKDRVVDLIHDLLTEKLDAIVGADSPKALFATALTRRAISWKRRPAAVIAETPIEDRSAPADPGHTTEGERQAFNLDARAALARLSSRDRDIVVAAAMGVNVQEIADAHRTSAANVYQIVSRVQRRFRGPQ